MRHNKKNIFLITFVIISFFSKSVLGCELLIESKTRVAVIAVYSCCLHGSSYLIGLNDSSISMIPETDNGKLISCKL